jgi:ABC-2 type transport system permease protein
MSRIATDVKYSLILFCRNRQSVFFAFVLPLLFLVMAWYLFGGQSGPAAIYYIDGDGSQASAALVEALNTTGGLCLVNGAGTDLQQLLKDGQIGVYMEIPPGFGAQAENALASRNVSGAELKVFYDGSSSAAVKAIPVIEQAVAQLNVNRTGAKDLAGLSTKAVPAAGAGYVDYLVPGILGIAIFGTALDMTVGFIAISRANGLLRKLATTPLSKCEWMASRLIAGTIVVLLSVVVTLLVTCVFFGARPDLGITAILLVIAGSVMSIGLGVALAYLIRDVQSAASASFLVTLPLILISGSLFPVDRLPWFLRAISVVSPMTYLNDGLQGAMIAGDMADALANLAIVGTIGIVLVGMSLVILRKGER